MVLPWVFTENDISTTPNGCGRELHAVQGTKRGI